MRERPSLGECCPIGKHYQAALFGRFTWSDFKPLGRIMNQNYIGNHLYLCGKKLSL
jgi:hypothetical protein